MLMKIKKGDKVIVIAGKERGKTGVVSEARPNTEQVVIDGLNIAKKHRRATRAGGKGQIIDVAMPIHVSNVMIVDPKGGKGTRIGIKREDGKSVRIAKKSGATL